MKINNVTSTPSVKGSLSNLEGRIKDQSSSSDSKTTHTDGSNRTSTSKMRQTQNSELREIHRVNFVNLFSQQVKGYIPFTPSTQVTSTIT